MDPTALVTCRQGDLGAPGEAVGTLPSPLGSAPPTLS